MKMILMRVTGMKVEKETERKSAIRIIFFHLFYSLFVCLFVFLYNVLVLLALILLLR